MLYLREEEDCCISRRKLLPSRQSKAVAVRNSSVTPPHTDTFPDLEGLRLVQVKQKSNYTWLSGNAMEVPWHIFNTGGNRVRIATGFVDSFYLQLFLLKFKSNAERIHPYPKINHPRSGGLKVRGNQESSQGHAPSFRMASTLVRLPDIKLFCRSFQCQI